MQYHAAPGSTLALCDGARLAKSVCVMLSKQKWNGMHSCFFLSCRPDVGCKSSREAVIIATAPLPAASQIPHRSSTTTTLYVPLLLLQCC